MCCGHKQPPESGLGELAHLEVGTGRHEAKCPVPYCYRGGVAFLKWRKREEDLGDRGHVTAGKPKTVPQGKKQSRNKSERALPGQGWG